jgi:polyisoprenoid-binding protein YceI
MRTSHRFATVAIAVATLAAPAFAQSGVPRAIDPAGSTATFSIAHVFVSRVTGSVPIVSGTVALAAGAPIPTAVDAVLDATKIHTDEPDRDAALESPDYFDTKQFPTWTFASTKIVATGATTFAMDGMLTMHGVSQPEHLAVTVRGDAAHPVFHAVGRIDRHAFGMRGARLDPVIGATADVTLDIRLL